MPQVTPATRTLLNAAVYDGGIDGAFVGARGGFRQQLDMLVLGVSAEINGAGISGSGDDGLDGAHFDVNWFGSLDVQAGLAFDRLLVYAIGGVAFAGIQHDYDSGSPGGNDNSYGEKTHTGFTIGGGLAFAVTDSIAIRLEGRHYEFDRKEFGQVLDIIPHTVEADFQTVTLGVEFTF